MRSFLCRFAAIMQNEFEDRTLNTNCAAQAEGVCFGNGQEVLNFYGVKDLSLTANIFVLLGLGLAFRFLAYLALRRNGPVYDTSL